MNNKYIVLESLFDVCYHHDVLLFILRTTMDFFEVGLRRKLNLDFLPQSKLENSF